MATLRKAEFREGVIFTISPFRNFPSHYFSLKCTVTVMTTDTGCPFSRVGV